MINISIIYALPEQQISLQLQVDIGCTAKQAIEQSGLLQEYPEIDLISQAIGIYGRKVPLEHQLEANDRVEIYRPLVIDPRDARMAKVKAERRKK